MDEILTQRAETANGKLKEDETGVNRMNRLTNETDLEISKCGGENCRTPREKLKLLYNLVKQFYIGICEAINKERGWTQLPDWLEDVLKELSVVLDWIRIQSQSAY